MMSCTNKEPPDSGISQRARHTLSKKDFLGSYVLKSVLNPYHPKDNPKGIINMGTAVNRLMEEELECRLRQSDALRYSKDLQHYYELYGMHKLRSALADFLSRHLCPERKLKSENIVVLNGVASCLDALGHAICDPGDVLICPTPVYARIFSDFCERALVDVQPLVTTEEKNSDGESFAFTPEDLENRIQELKNLGKNVKGIILVHPQNPLGNFYSVSSLQEILAVCARHKLHVVVDEIYALSVFKDEEKFISTLALDSSADPNRIYFVWGLTKDFGLAGLRVGVIHSTNQDVIKCLNRVATYQCTPSVVHHATTTILEDKEWCDNMYLPTNRRKLREAYEKARNFLEELGVHVRGANSAFFIWVNLQAFMKAVTVEDEIALFEELFANGLYVVPGSQLYCSNPGWFRLIFSVQPQDLENGLQKLRHVLDARQRLLSIAVKSDE